MKVLMIMGSSGSGKSFLEQRLIKNDEYKKIISFTTRPMRSGEVDGKDYYFINDSEYQKLDNEGKIIQRTIFSNAIYGSFLSEYSHEKINTLCIVPENAKILKNVLEQNFQAIVKIVYFDISEEQLIKNMKVRGDSDESIKIRLQNDNLKEQFIKSELVADYIVKDHDLNEQLVSKIEKLKF